jgi:hypothetical protein
MATTSFTAIRRFAGFAITLLFCLSFIGKAAGQSAPLVTVSSVAGLSHPTGWGTIQQTAIDSFGDWWVVDYANGALYEFPAGGGAAVTIAPPSPSASLGGGYQNPGIAIDPNNNITITARTIVVPIRPFETIFITASQFSTMPGCVSITCSRVRAVVLLRL